MIATYVSGHGFGHATRTAEVLRAVRERSPDQPLAVVTTAPHWVFQRSIPGGFEYRREPCDVGLVQKGALTIDEEATAERCRRFAADHPARVAREAAWLRSAGVRLVLGDIPPLAFEAAAAAGLPSIALGNFSWDWIYAHYASRQPALRQAAADAAAAYRLAGLLLELPFTGDVTVFRRRAPIPLVARKPRVAPHEVRRRLGLPGEPVVLLSFGGLGLDGFDPSVLAPLSVFVFLTSDAEPSARLPANVRRIDLDALAAGGVHYPELIGAADVVLTKPGYGIVADTIAARTRMIYTERGDFPEYPIMVREMPRYLACRHVSNQDLLAGRLQPALREVLDAPLPEPADVSGATAAARTLLVS